MSKGGSSGAENENALTLSNSASVNSGILFRTNVGASYTTAVERMRVQPDGKVGIGSTSPTETLDVFGTVKATEFSGDGSALTGVIGIGSGFTVLDSGSSVGTAATVNFGDNLSVQFSVGIATIVGAAGTDNIITDKLNVTGISTLQNDVLIGTGITLSPDGDLFTTGIATVGGLNVNGDITYDEVTGRNLNVSGIATVGFVTASNAFYTGVVTATTFAGNLSGDVTGNADSATNATNTTNIGVADESSDTTCNIVFVTGESGNLPAKTGTNLTFNSNTGDLAATSATLDHTTVGSAVTVSESGINVVGVTTSTTFRVGTAVTISESGLSVTAGVVTATTFRGNLVGGVTGNVIGSINGTTLKVGSAVTVSESGISIPVGVVTATTFRVGTAATLDASGLSVTAGVVTASSFVGDGSALTGTGSTANVRTGILDVAGIATFRSNTLVGSGITLSPDGHAFVAGIATVGRQIVGISTGNIVPFLFNNYSDLPSASTYHGQFAHVHVAGKAFYAHAGAWYQLVNVGSELTVGLGTEKYNVGILTATSIKVGSGATISSDGDSFVTGVSTATKFVGNLSDAVTSRWDVGANGSDHYAFTGPGGLSAADDPVIYLARGQTYEFNLNASGHPFHIQTSTGAYNASDLYTTGVTNPGAAVGVIKFSVPFSAPNTLYYVCQNHSSMNGKIVIYPDKQNP